jgi:hypothetical protein
MSLTADGQGKTRVSTPRATQIEADFTALA